MSSRKILEVRGLRASVSARDFRGGSGLTAPRGAEERGAGSSPAGGAEKEILSGIDFSINSGETVVLLGRNGAGKSTVASCLMGDPRFKVSGKVSFLGKDLLKLSTDKRAKMGILMSFQNPVEISGISTTEAVRTALEERKGGFVPIDKVREEIMRYSTEKIWFFERELNVGMSGGEKKKNEIFQLLALKPKLLILDEIDSGLDLDSAEEISKILAEYQRSSSCSYLIISHNLRVLRHLKVFKTILMEKGSVFTVGDAGLVKKAEKQGIRAILSEVSESLGSRQGLEEPRRGSGEVSARRGIL